jgi:serine/threonine-protein kinase HSL1, negative regulator of Swe1 kinase
MYSPHYCPRHQLIRSRGNHEKYFYSALLKHREEHLENYAGITTIGYSASDYQHLKATIDPSQMPPLPIAERSKSQYSILNDEHLHSIHSFHEAPPSDASYDPFRASRDPVIKASKSYMNVTVHRGNSNGSRGLRPPSVNHPHHSSLRVEALKRDSHRRSRISNSSVSLKGSSAQKLSTTRLSAPRKSMSRSSMGSSVWASSPPVAFVKPNTLHKDTGAIILEEEATRWECCNPAIKPSNKAAECSSISKRGRSYSS